jgi:phosphate starvation-inducible protein PhoH
MAKRTNKKTEKFHGVDTSFKLKEIKALTETQEDVFESWSDDYNLMLHGVAGTGKTFLALYLAFKTILENEIYNKVYIVRSSVPSRDLGFLPGTAKEKMAEYEAPYKSNINDLWGRGDAYDILKTKGTLEFISTSFLRGITLNNCIIIVDEIQNMKFEELDTVITRVGKNVKIICSGDYRQTDLKSNERSGLQKFLNIIDEMEEFSFIEFEAKDIVRSGLVKSYILKKLELEDLQSSKKVAIL